MGSKVRESEVRGWGSEVGGQRLEVGEWGAGTDCNADLIFRTLHRSRLCCWLLLHSPPTFPLGVEENGVHKLKKAGRRLQVGG